MPSFSVTITSNTTPAISVTLSGGVTYAQFKNSLGNYVYNVEQTYLYSTIQRQIQSAFNYSKYDSNGNQNIQSILSVISPYQFQNSIYIDTSDKNLIIDGRDYVRFNMLPNSNLQAKLYCDRESVGDTLDLVGANNFKDLEKASGDLNFFDQYVDIL